MKRELAFEKTKLGVTRGCLNWIHDNLSMWIDTCSAGQYVLRLEKAKKQRGVSQNALLWVWMDVMSKEWADATDDHYTKEQWKEFFARKFLPVTGPCGEIVGGSTSTLTTEQMTEFLTKIQVYVATEWGITLLGAEDNMFNEWRAQYE